ncbi:MAG TPA: hypothetical protein DIW17_09450 [Clostridiales bacterium]|nr:hypothetical protein [Clostridiales bacterium]
MNIGKKYFKLLGYSYGLCLLVICINFGMGHVNIIGDSGNYQTYIINIFNASSFHWIITTTYLYWIYKFTRVINHDYIKTRYVKKINIYNHLINGLLIQTAVFLLPYWIFSIITVFLSKNQGFLGPLIISLWNMSLGILLIGLAATVMNFIHDRIIINYIIIYMVLSLDYLSSAGYLRFDFSIVYTQLLSSHIYLYRDISHSEMLFISFKLLFKILLVFTIGLFTLYKNTRRVGLSKINKLYFKYALYAIPLGILLGAYYGRSGYSIEHFIVGVFGGFISIESDPISIVFFVLPLMLNLYLFINLMHSDSNSASVYIFTRSITKRYWYTQKVTTIILCSLAYYITLYCSSLLFPVLFGYKVESTKKLLLIFLSLIFTMALNNTTLLLISNILSLRYKLTMVYTIFIMVFLAGIILPSLFPQEIYEFVCFINPISQSILSIHDVPFLKSEFSDMYTSYIPSFSIWYSAIYAVITLFITSIWGYVKVNGMDLSVN